MSEKHHSTILHKIGVGESIGEAISVSPFAAECDSPPLQIDGLRRIQIIQYTQIRSHNQSIEWWYLIFVGYPF
jgi:hypothetical protein